MRHMIRNLIGIITLSCLSILPLLGQANIADKAEVKTFIDRMVSKHQFNKAELTRLFEQVSIQDGILKLIDRPYESKPWYIYRKNFLTQSRVDQGVRFWQAHEADLQRAERQYGVPASYIVAILGVETYYGNNQGNHKVIEALSTIAFGYPRRADYFRKELEEFLLLTREQKLNPLEVYGSYAGAMGQAQFMPSSYRHYAVDFTGSGSINLSANAADAIGSVANYFAVHGWRTGEPTVAPARVAADANYKQLDIKKRNAQYPLQTLAKHGVQPDTTMAAIPDKANIVKLDGENAQEYWLGFNNFYVITRYNTSNLYAMAVHQLAEKLAEQKQSLTS
jgi:membrane-bound lytic murein transglycosylase B